MPIVQADTINYSALTLGDSWCQQWPQRPRSGGDPLFGLVAPLVTFNGNNNDTTTVDLSRAGLALTFYNGAAISTAQSKFGGSSLGVPGAANARAATANVTPQKFTGPITIEFWLYLAATTAGQYVVASNYVASGINAWFFTRTPGQLACFLFGAEMTTSAAITAGAWHHVAAGWDGATEYFFLDGALIYSTPALAGSGILLQTAFQGWSIGGTEPSISASSGACYIDDFRVTYGACRYVSAFTPPISSFPSF